MVVSNNEIDENKCRQIDDDFDGHGDAAVRRGAHSPMEHIQGFTRSHWMLPSGECLRCIAPQNTNKTQLLPSNYRTFLLVKAI